MKYIITSQIGVNCITLEDGQKVFDLVIPHVDRGEIVELDFSDVRIVASPFLNAAIGQLLREHSSDTLNAQVRITNLPAYARPILKRVIDNAKEYYASEDVKQAVDKVMDTQAHGM